jgi:hypothetical protein
VTDYAAFKLCFVLINEWALLVGMALVADFVLANGGTQLVALKSAMRIVAVVALQ